MVVRVIRVRCWILLELMARFGGGDGKGVSNGDGEWMLS